MRFFLVIILTIPLDIESHKRDDGKARKKESYTIEMLQNSLIYRSTTSNTFKQQQ